MAAPVSLRQRHALETRRSIVAAATALFVEQGYEATTVDEIASRADVSPRTFFRYFATKEALLFHDLDERLAQIKEQFESRPPDEPVADSLVAVLSVLPDQLLSSAEERSLATQLLKERPSLRSYQRSTIAEHAEREITEALARRAGVAPDDLGLRTVVATVATCFDIAIRDWFEADAESPFVDHFRQTLIACRAGFPEL